MPKIVPKAVIITLKNNSGIHFNSYRPKSVFIKVLHFPKTDN